MALSTDTKVLLGVAVGVVVLGYMAGRKVSDAVAAVNPVSDQNIFYKGVNSVGTVLTGNQSFSLGSWLYDITH